MRMCWIRVPNMLLFYEVVRGVDRRRAADTGVMIRTSQDADVRCGLECIFSAAMATQGQLSALNVAALSWSTQD